MAALSLAKVLGRWRDSVREGRRPPPPPMPTLAELECLVRASARRAGGDVGRSTFSVSRVWGRGEGKALRGLHLQKNSPSPVHTFSSYLHLLRCFPWVSLARYQDSLLLAFSPSQAIAARAASPPRLFDSVPSPSAPPAPAIAPCHNQPAAA
jgi:hypothetical protein